jgi:hypothetical protein
VAVEIFENAGAHLQFGGADKNQFQAIESCREVGEGADGAPAIEFADEGDAQAVQGAFTIDGVEIQERLRGVLATLAVSGIDHGHAGGCMDISRG